MLSVWGHRVRPPQRLLRACDLPPLIASGDGRGRVVDLRQFVKDWAASPLQRRIAMSEEEPRRARRRHRLGPRRHDLTRIAAVVHALCDRDDVPVPDWVHGRRSRRPLSFVSRPMDRSLWSAYVRRHAPAACAAHNVWFLPVDLEDYRIHGFN